MTWPQQQHPTPALQQNHYHHCSLSSTQELGLVAPLGWVVATVAVAAVVVLVWSVSAAATALVMVVVL
jgi:hypothetical protein